MKKILIIGTVIILLAGCGKKENLLSPNYNVSHTASSSNLPTIVSTSPGNYGRIQDQNGGLANVQAEITITFSDYMDPATIDTNNIVLYNVSDGSYVDRSISFDNERKTAYITATIPNDAGFLMIVKNSVHNLSGLPLDGNKNGLQDGSPYDNAVYAFYTGSGNNVSNKIRTAPPTIASVSPGIEGNVSVHSPIVIKFSNGPLDTLKFITQNFHLKENGSIAVSDSIASFSPDSVVIVPRGDTLKRGTIYTFTIDAYKLIAEPDTVLKAITDTSITNCISYLRSVDTDSNNIITPDEDSFYTWKFITTGSNSVVPPQVFWYGDYSTYYDFIFTKTMDISTFTKDNIKVFDNSGYVPGTFWISMDSTEVKYYYDRTPNGSCSAWVSMEVKDTDGNMLDGNGNGVGGEPGVDDWSSP